MSNTDTVFAGSIPTIYDSHMVPLIFQGYADDLAERIAGLAPAEIIETACGTGVLPRAVAGKLRPGTRYVASDLNQPMVDYAKAHEGTTPAIDWQQINALKLPYKDASFDCVVCQFGAMFFPDKVAGFTEARRVLRPGGTFLFSVWDSLEENDFAKVVTDALAPGLGEEMAGFMRRIPHGYFDLGLIKTHLAAAGFPQVAVETSVKVSQAPSPHFASMAFCQGTPLRAGLERGGPDALEAATKIAEQAFEKRYGSGPFEGKISAHIFTAIA